MVGNVKTAIVGTLKSVAMRYVFRYLAEFQYRFNRRFKLPELLNRLASVATRAAPRPYKTLKILHVRPVTSRFTGLPWVMGSDPLPQLRGPFNRVPARGG